MDPLKFLRLLAGLLSMPASAASLDVTAYFRPDPTNPSQNTFINTTPQGGYCGNHPEYCENGVFSIDFPIRFRATENIEPKHDERKGAMFRVPSSWRDLTVINDTTGESEIVRMRVNGIGAAYTVKDPLPDGVWVSNWAYAPEPCQYGGVGYGGPHYFAFFWRVPADAGSCAKQAQKVIDEIHDFSYQDAAFSYELMTPNPLKMSSGVYRGVLNYTVGPYGDFDMGDVMLADDNLISLNFALSVEHILKVDIPPGGNQVVLEPQGGWQSWLNQGRKPTRLFRDQTFSIWASSRFRMNMECQYYSDNTCALWENDAGHTVPLEVSVSLPNGLTDATGQPVKRRRLLRDGSGTELFQPGFYLDGKLGTLHFEVARDAVDEMLKPGVARHYAGNVTVIWDSETD
ncbi:hypothetical protein J2W70_002345 [Pseudomonas koreensis]|uniref:hypothetical protein n=1 Tax=Pseudomonas koreensis TaxID=198620 RepID=UPI00285CB208|nr:hypothetical protein [Pseudomonas koreensis]MDR7054983.1 hypothetical protein [Pseudomonas koreensis]